MSGKKKQKKKKRSPFTPKDFQAIILLYLMTVNSIFCCPLFLFDKESSANNNPIFTATWKLSL